MDFTDIIKDKTAYMRVSEYERIIDSCIKRYKEGYKFGIRDMMIIKSLMHTGRRISEIVGTRPYKYVTGLRPIDFHDNYTIEFCILKKRHVRRKTKSGTARKEEVVKRELLEKEPVRRLIPVDKTYYEDMLNYIKLTGLSMDSRQRVFPLTRQRINDIIIDYAKLAEISRANKKISPHMFRHGYAILFLKKNKDNSMALQQLMQQLGHSSINITSAYLQFIPEDRRESVENMFK